MNRNAIARPFGNGSVEAVQQSSFNGNPLATLNARTAEIVAVGLAQMQIAKTCPRDMMMVQRKVESDFSRPSLAEHAMYAFPKGNGMVTGPSIRSAEALARSMGNIKYGYEELECNTQEHFSRVKAYAVDMESNVPAERVFRVDHILDTKKGPKVLTASRDIYEMVANQSMRRVRACILELIPPDLIDFAMATTAQTMQSNINLGDPHVIEKLLTAFQSFGVNKAMIEAKIGRNLSAILPQQFTDMRTVYASLRDGVGNVEDYFDINLSDAAQKAQAAADAMKKAEGNIPVAHEGVVLDSRIDDDSDEVAQPHQAEAVAEAVTESEEQISDEDMAALNARWNRGNMDEDSPF